MRPGARSIVFCRRGLFAGCAAVLPSRVARAEWPERSVTLLVCFPPGGATDVLARLIAPPLGEALGKPVVVENRGGAGGNIGMGAAARAQPDGHTLLVTSSAFVVNPSLYRSIPYDPFRDFAPITTLGASPNVIAVPADSPIRDFAQLLAEARARPDALNYASPGAGTTPHLAMEIIKIRAGIAIQHVPFSGAGPATQAALAGTVQAISAAQGSIAPQLRSGQLRPLAQTGKRRVPDLPDTPTLEELGIRDAESETFLALFAPAATPAAIVARLARDTLAILGRAAIQERFRVAGAPVVADGPAGLRDRVAREVPLWRDVIREARITVE